MDSMKNDINEVKGLKISGVNRCMIIMTCILVVCLLVATTYTSKKFEEMDGSTSSYMEIEKKADMVYDASDYLTEQARLFVRTMDLEYAELYFHEANVTRRREMALEELKSYAPYGSGNEYIEAAIQESNNLMKREIYAMRLISVACGYDMSILPVEVQEMQLEEADTALEPEAMIEKARTMMHDEVYRHSKATIHEHLFYFTQEVFDAMEIGLVGGKDGLSNAISIQRILLSVLIVINVLTFIAIFLLVVKPLYSYLNNIKEQSLLEAAGSYEFKYLAQVYNDIYAEREASAEKEALFKHKSEHDPMTGLLNRTSAEEMVRRLMEDREQRGILILLDLDDLKGINDIFGHKEGDKAILGISETLKTHFRNSDVIGRIGGDEFLVYLPNAAANRDAIDFNLSSLRKKLSGISIGADHERHIHCSMGCAVHSPEANTFEVLFKQADTALYHVKRGGKNNFAFYVPEMEQEDYQFREKKLLSLQSTRKFEVVELQHLLNSIASFYQLVISVNLSGNNYYLMEESRDGIFAQIPTCGALDKFIQLAAELVHPDDAVAFMEHLSRKALMRAYEYGEKSVHHYFRFQHQSEYRWIEGIVIFYTDEYGDVCDVTLLRWADERAYELERLWMQKVLDLAIVSSFEHICMVNLDSGKYILYGDKENIHNIAEKASFDEMTQYIRDHFIEPQERDAYYENAKLSTISARMRESGGNYTYRYTMADGERQASFHWFEPTQTQVLMIVQRCL